MKSLVLAAAAALLAGCGEQKEPEKPPASAAAEEQFERGPSGRRITDPSKKGQVATYKCECTEKLWTQPAEEEKLCLEECQGKMPKCGVLVKVEPAPAK